MATFEEAVKAVVADLSQTVDFVQVWDTEMNVNKILEENDFDNHVFVLYFAGSQDEPNQAGVIIQSATLKANLLFRIGGSEDMEADLEDITPQMTTALALAREFIFKLDQRDEIGRTGLKIESIGYTPLNNRYDSITYGYGINADVPFTEGITGCV